MNRNLALPIQFQLAGSHFQTTDFALDNIQAETKAKLDRITSDNLPQTQRSLQDLERIKQRFFDDIKAAKVAVKAIR